MKRKSIKILRILLYFIGTLFLFLFSFYYALRSPAFQTWAANRIGWYFSGQWGTTVQVDGVDIEFWKKIVLEGVYIEDQHRDTLLYAQQLKLDIGMFDPDQQGLFVDDIILQNAVVKLKQYKGESSFNFQFIIDEFAFGDTSRTDSTKWDIGIKGITLDNIRFAYKIEEDTFRTKGINFSDLLVSDVNAKISAISLDSDTTRCIIEKISLREKSGFFLKDFSAVTAISPVMLKFNQLKIISDRSSISANLSFKYNKYDDFNHFIDSVRIRAKFKNSEIEMEDVSYFSSELYGLKKKIFLEGDVSGKVSDLKGKNILLVLGEETSFKGNFDITGLPDIDQTFMSFDAKELKTSKKGIENIPLPPFHEAHSISLPENISLFGLIRFKGNFSGFYNDFVAYGNFNTALGHISTDISLKEDTLSRKPRYRGKFSCKDFNIGRFFESEKYVGRISMNAIVDGKGFRKTDALVSVQGIIDGIELNGYNYRAIDLKGTLARNIFNGKLTVNDENLHLDFDGNIDFSKSPTQLNFKSDITKANLSKLNLLKSDEYLGITGKIDVNAVGNNIDDATGTISLKDIVYVKGMEVFDFKDIQLSISDEAGMKNIQLDSYIADAKAVGKFKPLDIGHSLIDFIGNYLPSVFSMEGNIGNKQKAHKEIKREKFKYDFVYSVQLKKPDIVTRAFLPSVEIAPASSWSGRYNSTNADFSFNADLPFVSVNKHKFSKCTVNSFSKNDYLSVNASCQRFSISDSVWLDNVSVNSTLSKDTLQFKLNWHNNTVSKYEGDIPGYITFSGKSKMKLKLLPSVIIIADSSWNVNSDNEIVMDSSFISVKNLDFFCGNQRVKLEGNISEIKNEQMYLMLTSFSLENFNSFLKGTGFSVYGTISGNTSIANIYDKPVFGSSIDIKNMKLNKEFIGNGTLVSIYDSKLDVINFNGGFKRSEGDNLLFTGNYYPSKKENNLVVDAEVHDFRLGFFDPFLGGNFENLRGTAAAELRIRGTPEKPLVTGVIKAKVDNIYVNYLGTNYHFDGDIIVEPNSFDFANLVIRDPNNNTANIVNGKIFHNNYKNFQLDFDVNANKFLCLNTTEKDNSIYYGKFFATGIVNIFGFLDNINLSANIKTDKAKNFLGKNEYTQLFIPLSGSEEVGENSFISFVKHDTISKRNSPKYQVNTAGFTMDFKLQVTSDAQVQLIFDEKVGDIIKANGTGDIRMVINEFGSFKMYGDYIVDEGDYLFTLKNVVNKKFRLEKGGTIHWSGNPEEADLKMSAVYELRTSLAPLFLSHEYTDAITKRYPVDCIMNLSGRLLEPDISFDIKLPTTDEFTRQLAYDKFKNSENGMNQQVFSLMFTNSFSPPSGQGQGESSTGPDAGTVTSTEMLSNQLSNWLSQISNEFDVGVHYRPGDEINRDEVEVALSTQILNDKMTIDGSVANNSSVNNQNAANVVGDINVDYKLTDDGKLRAKAYNKANEGDILNTQKGPYTQGVGIFYKEEFETIGELYIRFLSKFKKQK